MLTFTSEARATSPAWPAAMSSRPDTQPASTSSTDARAYISAANAASTEADPYPSNDAITAPAPSRSSTAGRKGPTSPVFVKAFTPHRSPPGTTPIGPSSANDRAANATARAFRKHPANTIAPVDSANEHNVAPFGEGNSNSVPAGTDTSDDGRNDHDGSAGRAARSRSAQRTGRTEPPRPTTMSTDVENDSTSTITITAH